MALLLVTLFKSSVFRGYPLKSSLFKRLVCNLQGALCYFFLFPFQGIHQIQGPSIDFFMGPIYFNTCVEKNYKAIKTRKLKKKKEKPRQNETVISYLSLFVIRLIGLEGLPGPVFWPTLGVANTDRGRL